MQYNKSRVYNLSNKKKLADMLNLERKSLNNISSQFIPYKLPPEQSVVNGKERDLYNPDIRHKKALKKLADLLIQVDLPDYVYGGIRERSHIQNATIHKDNKYLMLIDIEKFFPSTSDSYVYDLFRRKFCMEKDIAKILTDFVTVPCELREGRYLPQGYPTSPILSYLAYVDMYNELYNLAMKNQMIFSCYYDDLTFSSDKLINKSFKRKCSKIINKYNFKIHPNKSKLVVKEGIEITGVFLDQSGKIKAPKSLLRKLQDCYMKIKIMDKNASEYKKLDWINEVNKLQGLIASVKSIEIDRKMDFFLNELKYIRKKYDVPYRKSNIKSGFKTAMGMLVKE